MSKVAIVFWSGTGNTQAMAEGIAEGVKAGGADFDLLSPAEFSPAVVGNYSAFAFGCPSMGSEVLEESEFQPMWDDALSSLSGKRVALFGSYGWGDGEWMRNWAQQADDEGMDVVGSYICNETPDADALAECQALGQQLV